MSEASFCLLFSYMGAAGIRIALDDIFLLGRSPLSDLALDDESISRRHFEIRHSEGRYVLTDLSGGNTRVNGQTSTRHPLEIGDVIEVRRASFTFGLMPQELQRTVRLSDDSGKAKVRKSDVKAVLSIVAGKKAQSFPLGRRALMGSAQDCDIVLEDEFASRYHCQIEEQGGRFRLRDLESRNGTWIGNLRIYDVELPSEMEFSAGRTRLFFRSNGSIATEAVKEDDYGITGSHPSIIKLRGNMRRLAPLAETVLIRGETGSGKELVARALHELSGRSGPFVPVNCGAIARDLIESELFGHVKGAFTGASAERRGAFEMAADGTIFLDEIGEMPLDLQPKLLRVLDSGELRRVGDSKTINVNARVLAATNRDLQQEVVDGNFREDLYFRLMVLPLEVPPLRERREDIPALAEHFMRLMGVKLELSDSAWDALIHHYWPGNVRELKNVITASVGFNSEAVAAGYLDEEHLMIRPLSLADRHSGLLSKRPQQYEGETLADMEKNLICETLEHYGHNKRLASRALGISKSTLYEKLKKYSIT